jgi:hypothetical protein
MKGASAVAAAVLLIVPAAALAGGGIGGGSAGGLTYYSGTVTATPGGTVGTQATCAKPGDHVVGGGFDTDTGSLNGRLLASNPIDLSDGDRKPDDGWRIGAQNLRQDSATAAAFAICSSDRVKYRTEQLRLKPDRTATLKAKCTKRTHVVSGGLKADSLTVQVSDLYPVDGKDRGSKLDDAYVAKVVSRDTAKTSVTVYAICAKLRMRYIVDTAFPIEPGAGSDVVTTICSDDFVAGGGVHIRGQLGTRDARMTAMVPTDFGGDEVDTIPDDRWNFQTFNDNPALGAPVDRITNCLIRG